VATRVVDGVTEQVDAAPLMILPPGAKDRRTYTPTRHTHEPMHDQLAWAPGPAAPDGTATGTLTISRWLLPGMEKGQPAPPMPRTEPLL
jgi:hypothetical protein